MGSIQEKLPPLLWPAESLWTRLTFFLKLWVMKLAVRGMWAWHSYKNPPSPSTLPTFTKSYAIRPSLTHRFFFPKNWTPGETLPLYIDIHGGGFAVGTPAFDDAFCSSFASRFGLLVVSIDYSKSPSYQFPVPTYDVAAITQALLADPSLPIDRARVAIGGFSAGGHLALSAAQLPEIRPLIKAVVPWYAPTSWTVFYDVKLASRPYAYPGEVDGLAARAPLFNHGYIPVGQDQRAPLLTINLAKAEDLPEWIFMIAAEYDMLADEAREMMRGLAGKKELTAEERYAFEEEGYKFVLVRGQKHGFTHSQFKSEEKAKKMRPVAEKMFEEAGRWLTNGPLKK